MKKAITPIIHVVFLAISVALIGAIVILIDRTIGFFYWLGYGAIEIPVIAAVVSSFVLWKANTFMSGLEKLLKPTIYDHLRQSALLYIFGFVVIQRVFSTGYYGGLQEGYTLSLGVAALWAAVINAFFLYHSRKSNIT